MLTKNVLYFGKDELLPERIDLRAGPFSLVYECGDLRSIKLGQHEVLRRVYVAIRDRNWDTIPPVFSNLQMEIGAVSFRITYDVENKQGEIDFAWQGVITGDASGAISFSMVGEARSTFWKNRIGFCTLYPAACAGTLCEVEHQDGTLEKAELPILISARQPVPSFEGLGKVTHPVEPGKWAEVRFDGDVFEMEDQRNWTDASYKIFSTPIRLPYPAEIQKGARVSQSIQVSLRLDAPESQSVSAGASGQVSGLTLTVDPTRPALALPPLGLGVASHGQPLSAREAARLKALHLDHLRVDLDLKQPDFPDAERLAQAAGQARQLGATLEAALIIPPGDPEGLRRLAEIAAKTQPPIAAWLIYPVKELFNGGTPVREVVEMARQILGNSLPGAKFAAGTNSDFIFLQRSLPPVDFLDEVTLAMIPEVHAVDNTSMIETLEAQPQVVASARKLTRGLPVRVSPVTLKMRFNAYASGAAPALKPDELPPQVDLRQMSLFGAGWVLGSLNALASSGVSSLTFFETTGWRGILETENGSPIPEVFQSIPGGVYPVYFVFYALGEFAGGEILPVKSSDAMAVSGMLLRKGSRQRILFANHTGQPQPVSLPGISSAASFQWIDETNAEWAMGSPEEFLAQAGEALDGKSGQVDVSLLPYAIGWLDF